MKHSLHANLWEAQRTAGCRTASRFRRCAWRLAQSFAILADLRKPGQQVSLKTLPKRADPSLKNSRAPAHLDLGYRLESFAVHQPKKPPYRALQFFFKGLGFRFVVFKHLFPAVKGLGFRA